MRSTAAGERLAEFGDKVTIVRSNYEQIKSVLQELGIEKVDGIYLIWGFPLSVRYGRPGFTYNEDDAPLDMRMDQRNPMTAADISLMNTMRWICTGSSVIIGEDKFAKNIAKHM